MPWNVLVSFFSKSASLVLFFFHTESWNYCTDRLTSPPVLTCPRPVVPDACFFYISSVLGSKSGWPSLNPLINETRDTDRPTTEVPFGPDVPLTTQYEKTTARILKTYKNQQKEVLFRVSIIPCNSTALSTWVGRRFRSHCTLCQPDF